MSDISTVSQYYNLYDSTKGYTELLFRAGKVLQSKEVNELQSMIKHQIKNVGDTILTDGDIVEGCQLVIDVNDVTHATVTPGKVYLEGNVRNVAATNLAITSKGTELVGVKLVQEVITPDDDTDLLEVASGYDNYNQDGAYRLRESVQVVLNDPSATTLYTIIDGQQVAKNINEDLTQLDKIQATLARRTFDESGNYKVTGLDLSDKGYHDSDYIYINLEPGRAYVKGYEVVKSAAQNIAIPRATDTRNTANEPKTFATGTLIYSLNNRYANEIFNVTATVEITETKTRSSVAGGIDQLANGSVVSVQSVKQGGTTYTVNTDYLLTEDGIDWSPAGAEPDAGSSYTVVYRYNKTLVPNTDYVLNYNPDTTVGSIQFMSNGTKPVNGTSFLVDYSYMLCRRDVVSIDKDGMIIVTTGQSDILSRVESPSVDDSNVLPIGSVLVKPKTDKALVINNQTKAISMLELYRMLNRIDTLEYNQAISDLDNEAASGEDATELMGIFTDGFQGFSKADLYHSEWTASVDLDTNELTLPFETETVNLVANTSSNYDISQFSTMFTAPYTESTVLSQPSATSSMRINSYDAFPKNPVVTLNPAKDTWTDTVSKIGKSQTNTVTLRRWWYHKNASWAASEKALWQKYGFADGGESLGWDSPSTTHSITETAVTIQLYMRQTTVKVTIQGLTANADNVVATFDGKSIALTPSSSSYRGTASGSLKANSNGVALGSFKVPANTLCGTRELKVWSASTPSLYGSANYYAQGYTIESTVYKQTTNLNATDPVAQGFIFDQDRMVTGVGIYLKDKDKNEPLIVQVRDMDNGYPGNTVYATKLIDGSAVGNSTDASVETKVVFDDPIYCNANTQYCFTVLSNSNVDSIWYATLNSKDVKSGTVVAKNPYLEGVMFSSSNNMTWTAHQSSDLKFNIYGAVFSTSGQVTFNKATMANNIDRILITSDESIPAGCSVSWQYSINNGSSWLPIEVYDDRELSALTNSVMVRCNINSATNVSPAISTDGLMLAGFSNKGSGAYVSKNVTVPDGFNTIKVAVDLHLPTGTNIEVYYATDTSGSNWTAMTSSETPRDVSSLYKEYTFTKKLGSVAKNYRVKLVLTTNNPLARPSAQNLKSILKTV